MDPKLLSALFTPKIRVVVVGVILFCFGLPGHAANTAAFPQGVVMHRLTRKGTTPVYWAPPSAREIIPAPSNRRAQEAKKQALFYLREVLTPTVLPDDLEGRLILRSIVYDNGTVDVAELRYRLDDLAIWVRQSRRALVVMVQRIGAEQVQGTAIPEEEFERAWREPEWLGWWKPEHQKMLDMVLDLAKTLFVREGSVPADIKVRGAPWPARQAPGIRVALYGTEAIGWGKYARSPDPFKGENWPGKTGPPTYMRFEQTHERLFLEFYGETDGQTVTFIFDKFIGHSLRFRRGGDLAISGRWFSE